MKTRTESELTAEIEKMNQDISVTRKKLSEIKKSFDQTESALIASKLKKEILEDELRRVKAADINQPPTYRELDIAAFRERLPFIDSEPKKSK